MKLVTTHWTEMRKILVPDECPVDNIIDMERYIIKNIDENWKGIEDTKHTIVKDTDTRDWEIAEVEENYKEEPF